MKMTNSITKLPTNGLFTAVVLLAFVAGGAGAAKGDILVNGLLDATSVSSQVLATPTGWVVDAFKTGFFLGPATRGFSGSSLVPNAGYATLLKLEDLITKPVATRGSSTCSKVQPLGQSLF